MKKLRISLIVLMILTAALPAFALKKPKISANKPQITDFMGRTLGKEVPTWIDVILEKDYSKLEKALKVENKKIYVVEAHGQNREFLKQWKDLINIENELNLYYENLIAQSVTSSIQNTEEIDEEKIQNLINLYNNSLKKVYVNDLERKASFWIQTQTVKPGLKKAKTPNDIITEYTYYIVYLCDMEMYETQMTAAISNIKTDPEQSQMLNDILTAKIKEKVALIKATELKNE